MQKLKKTLMAAIVGAALASGAVLAQSDSERSPSDGRSGGTGVPSAVSGATPSTGADAHAWRDPWPYDGRVMSYSLTDGRSGGAGVPSSVNGAVPSTSPSEDLDRLNSGDHASVRPYSAFDQSRFAQ
jgi:hypothetical protein